MSEEEEIEEGPELVEDEPETEWVGADEWGPTRLHQPIPFPVHPQRVQDLLLFLLLQTFLTSS